VFLSAPLCSNYKKHDKPGLQCNQAGWRLHCRPAPLTQGPVVVGVCGGGGLGVAQGLGRGVGELGAYAVGGGGRGSPGIPPGPAAAPRPRRVRKTGRGPRFRVSGAPGGPRNAGPPWVVSKPNPTHADSY
jgi:hypothetical protein